MKQRFTPLIAKTNNARFGKVYLTSWLLLLFLMMGNVAWGQNITQACEGQAVTFNANPAPSNAATIQWQVSTTTNSENQYTNLTAQISASVAINRTYSVSATLALNGNYYRAVYRNNGGNVTDTRVFQLTVNPTPTLSSTLTPTAICSGATFSYTPTSAVAGTTFNWQRLQATGITGGATSGTGIISQTLTNTTTSPVDVTYRFTLSANGCTNTQDVVVTVNPIPSAPTAADQEICGSGTVTLIASGAPAGGSYRWYNSNTATTQIAGETNASFTTPALAAGESRTFFVTTVSAAGCESATRTAVTATANPLPTVTLANFAPICSEAPEVILSGGAPTGGTYSGTGVSANGVFNPAIAGIGTHTITYTYTDANNCANTATNTITVTAPPVVSLADFDPVCQNDDPVTLSGGLPVGGVYSGTGVENGVFNPASAGVGTHDITYTVFENGCSSLAVSSITVNPVPEVTFTVQSPVCVSAPAFALTGGRVDGEVPTTGTGEYTGPGVVNGVFDPAVAGEGEHILEYTYTAPNGCTSFATQTIVVNPLPDVTLNQFGDVCESDLPITLTGGLPAGGTYSGPGVTNGTFNPSAVGVGTYTITYTFTSENNGCTNTATQTITVKAQPVIEVTSSVENRQICQGESLTLTASGADSYVWSPAAGLSATTGAVVTANPTITTEYTVYGITDGCQSEPITVTVTVNPLPNVSISPQGPTEFCAGDYVDLVTENRAGYTYQWYDESNSLVGESNILRVEDTGSYYVTITTDKGCTLTSETVSVIVAKLPSEASISAGTTTFCEGGSVRISANSAPTGQTYEYVWEFSTTNNDTDFAPIPGVGITEKTYVATASGYYRVKVSDVTEGSVSDCFKTSQTIQVTVLPQPTANITSSAETQCQAVNGQNTFTVTGTYTGDAGVWSATGGATVTETSTSTVDGVTTTTATVTAPASFSDNIVVTLTSTNSVSQTCNPASESVTLTVQPQIAGNTITGTAAYCQNATATPLTTVGALSGGTGEYDYLWQQSADNVNWGAAAGTNDLVSYTPSTATAGTTYYRRVVTSGTCSSTSEAFAVTITPSITENTIAGAQAYCQAAEATALGGAVTGGTGTYTYQWQSGPSATGTFTNIGDATAATYTPSTATAGTVYYRRLVTSGECADNVSNVVGVTVTPAITANTISGAATYCKDATASALSGTVTGGVTAKTYLWQQSPNGTDQWTTAGGTNNQVTYTPSTATVGTLYYRRVVTSENCSSESNAVAIVVNAPIAGNQISGAQTVCSGSPVAALGQTAGTSLSGGSTPYTYQWQTSATQNGTYTNVTDGTGAINATYTPAPRTVASLTTVYFRRVVNGGQCDSFSEPVAVTFAPNPTVTVNSPSTCSGTPTTISATVSGGVGPYNYAWTVPSGATNPGDVASFQTSVPGTYSVVVTDSRSCTSVSGSGTLTIANTPATPTITGITPNMIIYTGERVNNVYTRTLVGSAPGAGNTGTFSGPGITSAGVFNPCNALLAGQDSRDIVITYTVRNNATGCTSSVSIPVTVRRSTYTIVLQTNFFPVCQGVNTTYTARVLRDAVVSYPAPENIRTQPINVVSFEEDVTNFFDIDSRKNTGNFNRGATFNDASLSATDYYESRAIPKVGALPSCTNVTVENPIFSNRIYLGTPNVNIALVNPGSICPGTEVTFRATPSAVPGTLSYQWTINGTAVQGATGETFTTSTLQNGDRVAVNFTAEGSPCGTATSDNSITMVVVVPQTVTSSNYCAGTSGASVTIGSSQVGVSYQLVQIAGNGATTNIGNPVAGTGRSISFANQTVGTYSVIPIAARPGACGMFNQVTINETPLPTAFDVTGGGRFCTNGGGVPVGLSGSQVGINYQLRRSVNGGAPSNVGAPVAGTGAAISFGNQTVAGTYTVVATSVVNETTAACSQEMLNPVTIATDPLPLAVTATGGSYCAPTVERPSSGAMVTIANSQSEVMYQLFTSSGQPVGDPAEGTGGQITLGPALAGTYSIRGTNTTTGCTTTVGQASITIDERIIPKGDIIITNEAGEVIQSNQLESGKPAKFTASNTFEDNGDAVSYTWYTGDGEDGNWVVVEGVSGPVLTIASIPGGTFAVRVDVTADESACYTVYAGRYTTVPAVPLPVEIIYFTAAKQGHNVLLEWATASEDDNTGFEVQVSQDGFNFRKLDFVPTKNGNTVIKQVYTYRDTENGKYGTRYYRLKQIDVDGRFEYFTTKAVTFSEVASKVKAFPNPFSSYITLDIAAENSGEVQVTMWNAVGRQLLERTAQVEEGFNTVKLDVTTDLPHGIYFLRVNLDGKMHQLKLLKE